MDRQLFAGAIRDWLACDAELRELQKRSRELRNRRKELGKVVVAEMEVNNVTMLDTGAAHLRVATTKRKQPLTKRYLESRLAAMYGPGTEAYRQAEDTILNSRPITEHKELKLKPMKKLGEQ